jgi:hypothetical protein
MVASGDSELVKELVCMFRTGYRDVFEMKTLLSEKNYQALGLLHKAKSSVQ